MSEGIERNDMYAVIKTGGKQHKVKAGDVIEVEHLGEPGESVTFKPLLVVDDDGKTHFGKEAERAVVTALPVGDKKGDKLKVFRYRPKTGYAKRGGHRQMLTLLEITEVSLGAKRATTKKASKDTAESGGEESPAGSQPEAAGDVPAVAGHDVSESGA